MAMNEFILKGVKLVILFSIISIICIILSPLIMPLFIPLIIIFIGSILMDAQGTISFILSCYHKYNLLKIKYYYKTTPENESHNRLITGQTWNEFCDTLKAASVAISSGPQDALSQAEGYRFLVR
eukprot:478195_1